MWTVRENVSPDGIPIFVASSRVATGVGERYIAQNVIFVRGLATAISEAFVASNGLVCSCAQEGGEFRFHLTSDADYLRRAQGSKYVKSNPLGAYREVREALQGGQRVLFIGLPCQVAAMRNFVGSRLADSLYTIDLICHGSPSPRS